jgi:hypothetical protein
MTYRWIFALCVASLLAGASHAQEPQSTTPAAPMTPVTSLTEVVEEPVLSPFAFQGNSTAASADRRFWASGEFLFTWMRGTNLPSLVTTSPAGADRTSAGVLGAPGTTTLFGGYVDDNLRPGFRLGAGYWFDPEQTFGMEVGFMMIGSQTANFAANSTNGTILARPYTDVNLSSPQAVLVAFPGASNGSINIAAKSGVLYETHVDLTEKAIDVGWFRAYALIGYRYFRYDERLTASQTILPTDPTFVPGTQIVSNDNFYTRNEFNGGDVGFRWEFFKDNWSLELLGKVAVGHLNRTINIGGDQTISVPGEAPIVQNGGVLALRSNSGIISYQDWRAVPEFGATLNWQVLPNVSVRLGYTFMYFNGFARAGDQIDTTINTNNFPGSSGIGLNRPGLNVQRSDFWLQSINLGAEWTY